MKAASGCLCFLIKLRVVPEAMQSMKKFLMSMALGWMACGVVVADSDPVWIHLPGNSGSFSTPRGAGGMKLELGVIGRRIRYGSIGISCRGFGLTDDQWESIQRLNKESQRALSKLWRQKQARMKRAEGMSRPKEEEEKARKDYEEKREARLDKFEADFTALLTRKQKAMLLKFKEIAAGRKDEEQKVYEAAQARHAKILEVYEKKLTDLLGPEKMKEGGLSAPGEKPR